jgi:hypothetical protein
MPPSGSKRKSKKDVDVKTQSEEIVLNEDVRVEPIVLQLSIPNARMDELIEGEHLRNMLKYNPKIMDPQPYIPNNQFISENDIIETTSIQILDKFDPAFVKEDSNPITQESDHQVKSHHDTNCFWCCHPIVDVEYGMPIRYDVFHTNFTTFGSFCSLQCAAAHNYSVNMGCDRAWEIHSWIQLLGKKYGFKGPIRPAPSRYLLKMFHGPLTIEEFRKTHLNLIQTYVLNIPPFIHVSSQIESINTSFLEKDSARNEVGLRTLKRKIPAASKGALEQKMNLGFYESI